MDRETLEAALVAATFGATADPVRADLLRTEIERRNTAAFGEETVPASVRRQIDAQ